MPEFGSITGHQSVEHIYDEDIIIRGRIEDNCHVTLISREGSIIITGKIDNNCTVNLIAAGDISIGTEGDWEERKIDYRSTVIAEAGGSISLGHVINNHCNVNFFAGSDVTIGGKVDDNSNLIVESQGNVNIGEKIDNNSYVEIRTVGQVRIGNKIDNNCTVIIDSLEGGVTIEQKIDNNCSAYVLAAGDISIGLSGGSDDRKINNKCHVFASSGGQIFVGDKLGDDCLIEFRACGDITITSVVERGCKAFFETNGGSIRVRRIRDNNTDVIYWGGSLIEGEDRHESPRVAYEQWTDAPLFCSYGGSVTGEWWQNWAWKYGYVAEQKFIPDTLQDLTNFVASLGAKDRTKAVGGGWSFTDASLPFDSEWGVNFASIEKRGIGGKQFVKRLLEGVPGEVRAFPFDHQPNNVVRQRKISTTWNQARLTNEVRSGFHLPGFPSGVSIIDNRRLASSLQDRFSEILSEDAETQIASGRHFFHVEAGITIANLNILLDHQKTRLAIEASGGSPGATLAGTISTATHGGEFKFPLLVDRVKAIHLLGPGGQEWWIEGDESIADFRKLSSVYPGINRENFIAGDWSNSECLDGITANDVLKAVTVSMGVMGIIYSVVIEVVPAYGIQQKTKRIEHWEELLTMAGTNQDELRGGDREANERLYRLLLDGESNGTGISLTNNIYVDLAINPINLKCWIINRQVTPAIPREGKGLDLSMAQYEKSFTTELGNLDAGIYNFTNSAILSRVMDFLNYGRSISDVPNILDQTTRLISFLGRKSPFLATILSVVNGQANLNERFRSEDSRKRSFLGDILTGLLNVLMGTVATDESDITDLSYKVGAIGWSDEGMPGKGFEISLPSDLAFTFLQASILDLLPSSSPIVGYISIRVCPKTETLMGMQQFGGHSIMIEPVGFRTPESLDLFRIIQENLFEFNRRTGAGGMLHWGLENDLVDRWNLEQMAVNRPLRDGSPVTKLLAFKAIKAFIKGEHHPVFDNYFVQRLALNDYECELREVRATRKVRGNVVALCNDSELSWSPVSEEQAIQDILSLQIRYYVSSRGERVFIQVVNSSRGNYLRTVPNDRDEDNLSNLPDC